MRAVHIFAWVLMLVAIASADPEEEEEIIIYISEDAEIIYEDCPGDGQAAEQCSEAHGFCVETGSRCNGTFKIIHNSCTDHCSCCITGVTHMTTETPAKVVPTECYSRDQVPCSEVPDDENFPHPQHCNKFFKCDGGRVVTKTCNYGKLYNHLTGWCEYDMDEDDCMCPKEEEEEEEEDEVIPAELKWREDARCGDKYPLPNGEPAQCNYLDPEFPCCSNHGWCGNTDGHCTCSNCIDYREQNQEDQQGCPDGFINIDGSQQCFKFFNDNMRSWRQAKSKCEEEGLQLAEPDDEIAVELRKDLLDTYGDGGAWLGARGDGSNYAWESNDAELSSYNNLLRPGLAGTYILRSHCLGLVVTTGAWKKYSERPYGSRACSRDYYTLCEKIQGGGNKKWVGGSQSSRRSRP